MNSYFISFKKALEPKIETIVRDRHLHGLWLNTLSYLENCGARKIAAIEHPTAVKEEMLKHAAEEFRHAFYLKKQLRRLECHYEDYRLSTLLGGWAAYHYLNALDCHTARCLNSLSINKKRLSYLLVTYAIELRAEELYPLYQKALTKHQSKVKVQSILLEEKEHLKAMESELQGIKDAKKIVQTICQIEAHFFAKWLQGI